MKKLSVLLMAVLLLVLTACNAVDPSAALTAGSEQANANTVNQPAGFAQSADLPARTIMVNGTGQVTMTPDVAYVFIGVQSQSEDVAAALTDNNDKAQAIVAALRELGIVETDIQTSSFTISPQQQYGAQGEVISTVYVVTNTVNVTVRDLSGLGRLLDVTVRSGANSINGVQFDVIDKSAAIAEARRLAVESARNQAQEMAALAGVTLGPLQTMSMYFNNPIPTYDAMGGYAMEAASQVPVSAGQMVIRVEVNASYFIE